MGEDATLGDFVEGEDGSPGNRRESGETDAAGIEPARTTYAFVPDGGTCEACGELSEGRWHQDGDLVCSTCKEW
ncbi:DUF7573 domain-containing protein [Halorhabdus amylolytica]|uniref:DUF7573 domain-containing protein n=1 Tax=Halorhabdus amylolytica TaxID=2559573 RepID=UPI0010AA42A0|nr:hypothetical protein [Halorhabdus amylolytica]